MAFLNFFNGGFLEFYPPLNTRSKDAPLISFIFFSFVLPVMGALYLLFFSFMETINVKINHYHETFASVYLNIFIHTKSSLAILNLWRRLQEFKMAALSAISFVILTPLFIEAILKYSVDSYALPVGIIITILIFIRKI